MSSETHDVVSWQGTGRKTVRGYVYGLVLSLLFTFLAFDIVTNHSLSNAAIFVSLAILAITQLIAQVTFFLRLNNSPEGKWNLMPFIFILVIITVLVAGTLWIMYNLHFNMLH